MLRTHAIGSAVVLVLAAAVVWVVVRPDASDRLAELIAEMKAQGEPVTVAQLERPMPVVERNGAKDLEAARTWLETNDPTGERRARVEGPWNETIAGPWEENATPEQLAELDALLVSLAPFFGHLDSMAEADEIAWALGLRDTPTAMNRPPVDVSLVMLPRPYLRARAAAGATPEERLAAIRATLALGGRVRAIAAIEYTVAIMMHKDGALLLRAGIQRGDIDPAAARQQLDSVLDTVWTDRRADLIRAERAWAVELLEHAIDGSYDWYGAGANRSAWARLADRVARAVGGGGGPTQTPDDYIRWARELGESLDETAEEVWRRSLTPAGGANQLMKIIGMITGNMCEADAVARLARIALAAHEHRRLHGDWPASAEDLVPLFPDGVPVDPYTSEAFEFAREGDTLVLRARPWDGYLNRPEEADEKGLIWRLSPK